MPDARYFRMVVAALLAGVLLAACSQSAPAAAPTAPAQPTAAPATAAPVLPTDAPIQPTVAAAATAVPAASEGTGGSLIVYSGRSEALVAPIIDQFSEATGIQVDVRYGSTAEIAATLLEEGANSPADVFFAQDPGGLGAIAKAGLFASLPEDLVSAVPERFRSPDGQWVGISGRARVVVYNTDNLAPQDMPADIAAFVDSKWAGRIGWAPTNSSFQAMVTAMRAAWGEDRTREWLEGMAANQTKTFEGNAQIVEAVAAGEIDAGLVNHYYLYRFLQEQGEAFKARNHFLTGGGPGSLIMVAGAGRLASGKNEANAIKFLQFMLSPVAQQYFAGQTFEYPVVEGVVTPRGLPPMADLDAVALNIAMNDLHDLQGTTQLLQDTGVLP